MNNRLKKSKWFDTNQMRMHTTHVTLTQRIHKLCHICRHFRKFVCSRPRYHKLPAAPVLHFRAQEKCSTSRMTQYEQQKPIQGIGKPPRVLATLVQSSF